MASTSPLVVHRFIDGLRVGYLVSRANGGPLFDDVTARVDMLRHFLVLVHVLKWRQLRKAILLLVLCEVLVHIHLWVVLAHVYFFSLLVGAVSLRHLLGLNAGNLAILPKILVPIRGNACCSHGLRVLVLLPLSHLLVH